MTRGSTEEGHANTTATLLHPGSKKAIFDLKPLGPESSYHLADDLYHPCRIMVCPCVHPCSPTVPTHCALGSTCEKLESRSVNLRWLCSRNRYSRGVIGSERHASGLSTSFVCHPSAALYKSQYNAVHHVSVEHNRWARIKICCPPHC
jgi:hypothetical protein